MEYKFLTRWAILLTCLILAACIKQIDFESTDLKNTLVVDGVILAGVGPHTLTLSTTGQLGQDTFPAVTDATVFLYDEAGFKYAYKHIGGGEYIIEIGVVNANIGKDYFIEILRDNKTFRSRPERIPEQKNMEGLSYRIEGDQFILEAKNTNPDNGGLYLKWGLENIYSITELICNPFISPKRCFIYDELHIANIPLLDATLLQTSTTFKYDIISKRIDFTFGNPQSFYITQQTITAEAFNYWSRIDLVSNQLGSLLDPPPASVRGNIYNIDDPAEIILGYFGAIAEDSDVLFTNAGIFFEEFELLPYCGIPGFEIYAPGCCNCIELENSTWEIPFYW